VYISLVGAQLVPPDPLPEGRDGVVAPVAGESAAFLMTLLDDEELGMKVPLGMPKALDPPRKEVTA